MPDAGETLLLTMQAWWDATAATGTTIANRGTVGSAIDMTLHGAPLSGGKVTFDGVAGYGSVPNNATFQVGYYDAITWGTYKHGGVGFNNDFVYGLVVNFTHNPQQTWMFSNRDGGGYAGFSLRAFAPPDVIGPPIEFYPETFMFAGGAVVDLYSSATGKTLIVVQYTASTTTLTATAISANGTSSLSQPGLPGIETTTENNPLTFGCENVLFGTPGPATVNFENFEMYGAFFYHGVLTTDNLNAIASHYGVGAAPAPTYRSTPVGPYGGGRAPGTATYQVTLVDRDTGIPRVSFPIEAVSGSCTRVRNTSSQAELTITKSMLSGACCDDLSAAQASMWAWEARIDRFDRSVGLAAAQEPLWIGPIVGLHETPRTDTVQITAQDRSSTWTGIVLDIPIDTSAAPVEATTYAQTILARANALYPPGVVVGVASVAGLNISRTIPLTDYKLIYDEMTGSYSTVADWTIIGRICWLLGRGVSTNVPALTGDMWQTGGPSIEMRGSAYGSHVLIRGNGVSAVYPAGPITAPTDQFKPWGIRVLSYNAADSVNTTDEALALAEKIYNIVHRLPVYAVTGEANSLGAEFSYDPDIDLIPGRSFIIAPTEGCFDARAVQRLNTVTYTFANGLETSIVVDLAPDDPSGLLAGT